MIIDLYVVLWAKVEDLEEIKKKKQFQSYYMNLQRTRIVKVIWKDQNCLNVHVIKLNKSFVFNFFFFFFSLASQEDENLAFSYTFLMRNQLIKSCHFYIAFISMTFQ